MDTTKVELFDKVAVELARNVPGILWWLLALFVVLLFYRKIRDELLPNLSAFKAAGLEISFVRETIAHAIQLAEKSPKWPMQIPAEDKEKVLNRAKVHARLFKEAKFLWIDDLPENNRNEFKMLSRLGVDIDYALDTAEALAQLQKEKYDLILSDMARGDNKKAGLEFLEAYKKLENRLPVIFYVGTFSAERGTPPFAFGITNRPDELLHLTMDALGRKKY